MGKKSVQPYEFACVHIVADNRNKWLSCTALPRARCLSRGIVLPFPAVKIRNVLSFALASATLVFIIDACSLLGTDIMDRINAFSTGLNNPDRSAINANFDKTLTQNLPTMTTTWWSTNFPVPPDANHPYIITLIDYSNPTNVTATIMGPPAFNGTTGLPINAVFVMSVEGPDWFIEKLYLNGSSTPIIQ